MDASNIRLFQKNEQDFVLLCKDGRAVQFRIVPGEGYHVVRRLEGVDFKATGDGLRQEGWNCVGPGLEYTDLLQPK